MNELFDLFPALLLAFFALLLFGLLVWSLAWVYRDAGERGKPGCLVAVLVFLLSWPVSLLAWIVFRPEYRVPR